ncbi:MAG: hypothetical protein ABIF01_04400 [Candidatus Micrarchaeota archaeon]
MPVPVTFAGQLSQSPSQSGPTGPNANRILSLVGDRAKKQAGTFPQELGRLHPFVPRLLEDVRKVVPEGDSGRSKPRRPPERKIEVTTGIIDHPAHATDFFSRLLSQCKHKSGELITGTSNHQLGSHTHPSLFVPFDENGSQYADTRIKVVLSSKNEAYGLTHIGAALNQNTLPNMSALELSGRTMVAAVVFGPQDSQKMPFILQFETGRKFSEVESYVFDRILRDQHIGATKAMIITVGMFTNVLLQKPEAGVPVLERKPGPQKKKIEVATSAPSQALAPGITVTDMRFNNGTSSYVTYGVFDCGAKTTRGKELVDKPFEGGNVLQATVAGPNNFALVFLG